MAQRYGTELPCLEAQHWEQLTAEFEIATIRDAFEEITERLMDDALQTRPSLHNKETNNQPQMDGKGVFVIGHFFWHIHGTREASKIPLPHQGSLKRGSN